MRLVVNLGGITLDKVVLPTLGPNEEFSVGRLDTCGLVLSQRGVSRLHAVIVWNGTDYMIRDQNSKNGTFVNDKQIIDHVLAVGNVIEIANYQIAVAA
ncbi:MAG: FHA domain-containing protein [Patescibacteria group bacterium]